MKFIFIGMLSTVFSLSKAQDPNLKLFIGTYTEPGKSIGIYVYDFNEETGEALQKSATKAENPSYLAVSEKKDRVYAVHELGNGKGSVSAFRCKPDGSLVLLNKLPTHGDAPCHVVADRQNRYVVVSNYSGGSLSIFETEADGSLKRQVQHIQHIGSGPDQTRQQSPHVHSATFSPDERYLLVQDLGTDQIHILAFHPDNKNQPFQEVGIEKTSPAGGPRHIAFSDDGKHLYLIEEMGSTVDVYRFKRGKLSLLQTEPLLPANFDGKTGAADLHISPDGKFLYATNRGDANDITTFEIKRDGRLERQGKQSVMGRGPRNFAISPNGQYLLVANQYTDEVVIFKRNAVNGELIDTGRRIAVGTPVCLQF